jgi:hypothetical protein
MSTATNFTYTGTPTVNISNNSATASTVNFGTSGATSTNVLNFNFTTGTYTLTLTGAIKNLDFTGFSGTLSNSSRTIYGDLKISTGMTLTAGSSGTTFAATSGIQKITSDLKTFDFPVTIDGVGGTLQLQDNLTLGSTRSFTLTNGSLDLVTNTLSSGTFSSSNSNIRSILFGTTNITVTGSSTLFNMSNATNFTYTGTPTINISNNSATTSTVTFGPTGGTSINAPDFNFTTGTYLLNLSGVGKNLDFTGFSGTLNDSARSIFGNLTLSTGMTLNNGFSVTTFAATSGTKTITSNTRTMDFPITISGGATYQILDALTLGSNKVLTVSAGEVQWKNGVTHTAGTWLIQGTIMANVIFKSLVDGSQYTLSQATGTTTPTYLTISDSIVTGGATWSGTGTGTTNGGNNTGWTGGNFVVAGATSGFLTFFI